jgi:hypothetical protein
MRLIDLQPRWLSPDVFIFLCPHCQKDWLLCKRVVMSFREQCALVLKDRTDDEDWPADMVPMAADACWTIVGNFDAMTVTPSIDAGKSGHWHGHITNGEIK